MGFDYEICYKKGKENAVADGLSRIPAFQLVTIAVSSVNSELLELVKQSWQTDIQIQEVIGKLHNGEVLPKYNLA